MPNLDLKDARIGMVLGQDIMGTQGQLLFRAGAVLNDKHLQVLRANQVRQVAVGAASPANALNTAADGTNIEARIEERFRISDAGQPLIQELQRLCRERLTQEQGGSDDD